jgi:hypothetical protein
VIVDGADFQRSSTLFSRSLRRAARVTRDAAAQVTEIATQREAAGHDPERVAKFLVRGLFTMFAEDVRLLRERIFSK